MNQDFDLDDPQLQQLLDAAATSDRRAWPQTLADLIDLITAHFQRRGVAEPVGEARALVALIANYFGGRPMYLPRGQRLATALRDAALYAEYDGANVHELARRHRISVAHAYYILAQQRRMRGDQSVS